MLTAREGTTITELQKLLGFGNSVIVRWEHSIPMSDKLSQVADHFCVSVDYLLGRTDDPTPFKPTKNLSINTLELLCFLVELNPTNQEASILLDIVKNTLRYKELET